MMRHDLVMVFPENWRQQCALICVLGLRGGVILYNNELQHIPIPIMFFIRRRPGRPRLRRY